MLSKLKLNKKGDGLIFAYMAIIATLMVFTVYQKNMFELNFKRAYLYQCADEAARKCAFELYKTDSKIAENNGNLNKSNEAKLINMAQNFFIQKGVNGVIVEKVKIEDSRIKIHCAFISNYKHVSFEGLKIVSQNKESKYKFTGIGVIKNIQYHH